MFKLAKVKTVFWPVKVQIPGDGGKSVQASFEAEFAILDTNEFEDIILQRDDERRDALDAVLVGWRGVKDEDGQSDVAFTPETKKAMLAIPYARAGLLEAYGHASMGGRRKN